MQVIHQNCDPELANDRSLPYTAYIVTYKIDGEIAHDLIIPDKHSEIFDYYWDRYREGLQGWKQSEGRVNPRIWGYKPTKEEKKKR